MKTNKYKRHNTKKTKKTKKKQKNINKGGKLPQIIYQNRTIPDYFPYDIFNVIFNDELITPYKPNSQWIQLTNTFEFNEIPTPTNATELQRKYNAHINYKNKIPFLTEQNKYLENYKLDLDLSYINTLEFSFGGTPLYIHYINFIIANANMFNHHNPVVLMKQPKDTLYRIVYEIKQYLYGEQSPIRIDKFGNYVGLNPKLNLFNKFSFANKFKEFLEFVLDKNQPIFNSSTIVEIFGSEQNYINLSDEMKLFRKFTQSSELLDAEENNIPNFSSLSTKEKVNNSFYNKLRPKLNSNKPTEPIETKILNIQNDPTKSEELKTKIINQIRNSQNIIKQPKQISQDIDNINNYLNQDNAELEKIRYFFEFLTKIYSHTQNNIPIGGRSYRVEYGNLFGINAVNAFILFYIKERTLKQYNEYAGNSFLYPISKINFIKNLTNLNENEYINFNPNSLFDIYPKETLYTCEINIRPNTPFNFSACTERGLFELIKLISFDMATNEFNPTLLVGLLNKSFTQEQKQSFQNIFTGTINELRDPSRFNQFVELLMSIDELESMSNSSKDGRFFNLKTMHFHDIFSLLFPDYKTSNNQYLKQIYDAELNKSFRIPFKLGNIIMTLHLRTQHTEVTYYTTQENSFYSYASDMTLINIIRELSDANELLAIENLNVKYVSKFNMAFQSIYNIKDLDLSLWNTKNAKSFASMFSPSNYGGKGIENWDISNVQSISEMFNMCKNIGSVDFSKWDVKNIKTMVKTFAYSNVNGKTLENWNLENAIDIDNMLEGCTNNMDLTKWDAPNLRDDTYLNYLKIKTDPNNTNKNPIL